MTRRADLIALRDKVKAGSCPLRLLANAGFGRGNISQAVHIRTAFNGSLDAAKAVHEAVLPGWDWAWDGNDMVEVWSVTSAPMTGFDADPARAWLLAILEALIAQEPADDPA